MSVSVIVVCGSCSSWWQTQMLFRMLELPTKKEKKGYFEIQIPYPPLMSTLCTAACLPSLHPFDVVAMQQCSSCG